jgi:uncharacterized protein (TIGR02301 family)
MMRLALAFMVALAAGPSLAQQRPRATPPPAAQPAPPPEPPETPLAYEPELLRLSEALGTIAYMAHLCGEPGAEGWRQRAQQLIEAEGATQGRKDRLAGAYNRGYIGHQAMHRTCTDAARSVIERRLKQAREITQDISTRFGG